MRPRQPSSDERSGFEMRSDAESSWGMHRIGRRRMLVFSSATVVSAILAACGSSNSAPTATVPARTASSAASVPTTTGSGASAPSNVAPTVGQASTPQAGLKPKSGGTLVTPIDTDPPNLLSSVDVGTTNNYVGNKIFEPLLVRTREAKYEGVLAKSWELGPDGKSWTFKLQQGVKWHDGMPFTSADVQFTFIQIAKNQSRTKTIPDNLEMIETPDTTTAIFHFKQPLGPFLSLLDASNSCIGPKHLLEGTDIPNNPAIKSKPVGTGPFKLKQWTPGQRWVYERNPDYWNKGLPYLDQIISPVIPDSQARVLAFEAGEIDYIPDYWLPKDQFTRLSKLPGVKSDQSTASPGILLLECNLRRDITKDKRVRQALFTAIDKQFLVGKVWLNLVEPVKSAIPQQLGWPYNPAVDLTKQYAYDPEKAKKMLDDAGFPVKSDGNRFSLKGVFDSGPSGYQQTMEAIKAQLKQIGVDVQLVGLERQGMVDTVYMKWDFDITLQNYGTFNDPTAGVQRAYLTSNIGKSTFNNASAYSNPQVDDLFKNAANSGDQDTRQKFFFQVQPILAEDVPVFPLLSQKTLAVARDYVNGFWHTDSDTEEFGNAWLNK